MIIESFGNFKICAKAQKINNAYRIKGQIIALDKSIIDEQDLFSRNDHRLTRDYSSSEEADMTFLAQAKVYLQANTGMERFHKKSLLLVESKNNNTKYKVTNYNGSVINILPAIDNMLQIDLSDVIEKQDDLTETYHFLQNNIITQQDFDVMTEGKIGIFPQKILLGTQDGYKICGVYSDATHTLSTDTVKFSIKLPEYLDNCVVCVDVAKIEI